MFIAIKIPAFDVKAWESLYSVTETPYNMFVYSVEDPLKLTKEKVIADLKLRSKQDVKRRTMYMRCINAINHIDKWCYIHDGKTSLSAYANFTKEIEVQDGRTINKICKKPIYWTVINISKVW